MGDLLGVASGTPLGWRLGSDEMKIPTEGVPPRGWSKSPTEGFPPRGRGRDWDQDQILAEGCPPRGRGCDWDQDQIPAEGFPPRGRGRDWDQDQDQDHDQDRRHGHPMGEWLGVATLDSLCHGGPKLGCPSRFVAKVVFEK